MPEAPWLFEEVFVAAAAAVNMVEVEAADGGMSQAELAMKEMLDQG